MRPLNALPSTQDSDQFAWRDGVYGWQHGNTKQRVKKDTNKEQMRKGKLLCCMGLCREPGQEWGLSKMAGSIQTCFYVS